MKDGNEGRLRKAAKGTMVLLALLGLTFGCGPRRPPTIMVITPTGGLEYWEHFDHEVKANAASTGIHAELAAPQSVTDYTEQAQMVEKAIAGKAQGIIVAPSHQLVLTSVLQKAVQAHIPDRTFAGGFRGLHRLGRSRGGKAGGQALHRPAGRQRRSGHGGRKSDGGGQLAD
jgi:ABC-type sugar transport system substrate-binding protein